MFNDIGEPACHILSNSNSDATKRAIVVEAGQWHAMTAAPKKLGRTNSDISYCCLVKSCPFNSDVSLHPPSNNYCTGYQGHAFILEMSGHYYSSASKTKRLASFAPIVNDGLDGDPKYFEDELLPLCASIKTL